MFRWASTIRRLASKIDLVKVFNDVDLEKCKKMNVLINDRLVLWSSLKSRRLDKKRNNKNKYTAYHIYCKLKFVHEQIFKNCISRCNFDFKWRWIQRIYQLKKITQIKLLYSIHMEPNTKNGCQRLNGKKLRRFHTWTQYNTINHKRQTRSKM